FWTSSAARQHLERPQMYSTRVYEDGSFASLERLPPGKYLVLATFKKTWASYPLVVPDGLDTTIDIGEIKLR
ncbi:MAG TPA: carboxypeptidase-like regulatory domain-containing protein, partial [Methylomirabilota bacterium]|nr:carboxypeptidase-like regulatory domain-containing protein [Methylomirabilota bacterium]